MILEISMKGEQNQFLKIKCKKNRVQKFSEFKRYFVLLLFLSGKKLFRIFNFPITLIEFKVFLYWKHNFIKQKVVVLINIQEVYNKIKFPEFKNCWFIITFSQLKKVRNYFKFQMLNS